MSNSVNVPLFQSVLDAFAASVGAGPAKRVIIVLDNAGWHVSKNLKIPEGISFCFLPPYTPELQPAERLWPLVNEAVANKRFDTLDELTVVLDKRCSTLTDTPEIIQCTTKFNWWDAE